MEPVEYGSRKENDNSEGHVSASSGGLHAKHAGAFTAIAILSTKDYAR